MTTTYDFAGTAADGTQVPLHDYAGQGAADRERGEQMRGLTLQYEGLEALYRDHQDHGLEVLGFLQPVQGTGTRQRRGDPGLLQVHRMT